MDRETKAEKAKRLADEKNAKLGIQGSINENEVKVDEDVKDSNIDAINNVKTVETPVLPELDTTRSSEYQRVHAVYVKYMAEYPAKWLQEGEELLRKLNLL